MTDVVTLTLNPAVDVSTDIPELIDTRKLRCGEARYDPGGGGVNVARVVHRLGGDCAAIYLSGGRMGMLLQALLDAEQVPNTPLPIADETRFDFAVTDKCSGKQYRFVLRGPLVQQGEWTACMDHLAAITPPRFLVMSGSLPPGIPVDYYARLSQLPNLRGAEIVVDASGEALKAAMGARLSLVKPSLRELQELMGEPLTTEDAWIGAAREILREGRTQRVAITLGEEGALLVTLHEAIRARCARRVVESTIGAGDSFLGAMVWALNRGCSDGESFRFGMAAADATLDSPGTGLCQRAQILRAYDAVVLENC